MPIMAFGAVMVEDIASEKVILDVFWHVCPVWYVPDAEEVPIVPHKNGCGNERVGQARTASRGGG